MDDGKRGIGTKRKVSDWYERKERLRERRKGWWKGVRLGRKEESDSASEEISGK